MNLAVKLLASHPVVLAAEQSTLKCLSVDEYQDLNPKDQEFTRQFVSDLGELCVVGDEDQSIYESQRFADPSGLVELDNVIPKMITLDLTRCHRCPDEILEKAESLIKNNQIRIQGKPRLRAHDPAKGGIVFTSQSRSKKAEMEWVIGKISELCDGGAQYRDILVLFSGGKVAKDYISAMQDAQIPLDIQLRIIGPFDSQCFSMVHATLHVVCDQEDNLAVRQCLDYWPNIGPKTIRELRLLALSQQQSLWEAVFAVASDPDAHAAIRMRRSVQEFHAAMTQLLSVGDFDRVIGAAVQNLPNCREDKGIQLIDEYFQKHAGKEGVVNIKEVLGNFEQDLEAGKFEPAAEELPNKVRIMTMHSAKGLEAEIVIIPALEDDLMPGQVGNVEERRRLFYVSITRAKRILLMSWASQRMGQEIHRPGGRMLGRKPSRFLREMGEVN